MLFYDFEVFKHDWLVVIKDTTTEKTHTIVNDSDKLIKFYERHTDDIWIGYNSKHYDQYILKSIILGFSPQEMSNYIIEKGEPGWKFSKLISNVKLFNYDCMINPAYSLKQLEGFMGHDIRETTVPFDIPRKLTPEELEEVIFYCNHDVEQTMEVFIQQYSEFESVMLLIMAFNLPLNLIGKTQTQLAAMILEAKQQSHDDEFDLKIADTIKLHKYKHILDWYKDKRNLSYDKKLHIDVAGVPHIFAWGGLHGAVTNYMGEGVFINSDVGSFYPALMIEYDLLSRNVKDKKKYKQIRDKRLVFKAEKNPLQLPYKLVLNKTYGASKDKNNPLYDPRQANNVCVNGQLMLLDLIEHVESAIPGVELIQSNTDGVMFKLPNKDDIPKYMEVCNEWSKRTRMELEHDHIKKVIQKDVNNYMVVMEDGTVKSKGAYVKKLNPLDYDLPIINKAVREFFINNTPVEETINNCNELKEFQKIVKISSKFDGAFHNDKQLKQKVFRVFASRSRHDGALFKLKMMNPFKIANTSERCFIVNEDVTGVAVPRKLDRKWYIELANKRIYQFLGNDKKDRIRKIRGIV